MEQGSFNRFEEYTKDERVCGVWVDGSKIYRKSFTHKISSYSNPSSYTLTLGVTNFDKLIKIDGTRVFGIDAHHSTREIYSMPDDVMTALVYPEDNEIEVVGDIGFSGYNGRTVDDVITIYYTKTSS